ncbi:hypothetical protein I7I51_00493 [Histoplasma capsulatum]|uniref:Major facilitator superfamily (MFS) profile domain-containing protein n=1 Tax=Ajellomyces capsulatus TaxID=5037 RepID=A0A8A1MC70_AJECA|nr:predicted protein [Histoplasma mississippiense (nom. inval.)]EDN08834.1 predicted protein [Histoplasma mississippiense (nom. inval.)]QSS63435.1 hypothetical protein I7I51_00493 [Histoplasma capsulatum]
MLGSYIYIFAAIISVLSAWLSDRQGQRSLLLFFHVLCIVVGYTIIISGSARGFPGVVYFGTFVVVSGIYPALPAIVTWLSNNMAGDYKSGRNGDTNWSWEFCWSHGFEPLPNTRRTDILSRPRPRTRVGLFRPTRYHRPPSFLPDRQ